MKRFQTIALALALLAALFLLAPLEATAQRTTSTARRIGGGDTPPATCSAADPADVWIDTNAAAGSRLLVCTAPDTWTAQGGTGTVTGTGTAGRVAQWSSSAGIEASNVTLAGPTAARTVTLPDANFTAARTDAAQTFTGTQTFSAINTPLISPTGNVLEQSNATSAQAFRVYGTTNGGANYERLALDLSANSSRAYLIYEKGGTGTNRSLWLYNSSGGGVVVDGGGGAIAFSSVGTQWWQFNTGGHLMPGTDNTRDIGTTSEGVKKFYFGSTVTAPGTTGNQTINKSSGRVNVAAAGTSVTVTNDKVTANSHVMAVVVTNDSTAYVKNVVPAAGSFTINLGAAATAEVAISFVVFN